MRGHSAYLSYKTASHWGCGPVAVQAGEADRQQETSEAGVLGVAHMMGRRLQRAYTNIARLHFNDGFQELKVP